MTPPSPSSPSQAGPAPLPLLGPVLLAAGLACLALAVASPSVDFAALIARPVGAARGAVATAALAALRAFDFRTAFLAAAAALTLAGLAAWRFHREWPAALLRFLAAAETAESRRRLPLLPLAAAAVILVRFLPTLTQGYFRYDDFELLSVARELPWHEALWLPHGDHFMPLTRLLVALGYGVFGVAAWPWNAAVLACLWAVAALGCLLLRELRCPVLAQGIFLTLLLVWSPWAEFLAGYYILSSYTAIAALGLAAAWCWLRWRRTPRPAYAAGLIGGALAATLLDVSGWYVPAALALLLGGDLWLAPGPDARRRWLAQNRGLLLLLGAALALSLAAAAVAYGVLHRGTFLSMGGGGGRSLARLGLEFAYLFDAGLLVSLAVPFVYARLPAPALLGLGLAAFVLWGGFMARALRSADRREKLILSALGLILAGTGLMVNLGRPSADTVIVRWAAKHLCPAYVCLCLLLAAAWQITFRRQPLHRQLVWLEATVVVLGLFCTAQTLVGRLGLLVSFPPFGYAAELRDAGLRRQAVAQLRDQLVPRLAALAPPGAAVPAVEGAVLAARHPSLFEYNISHYDSFLRPGGGPPSWLRHPAMQDWHARSVTTVPDLRAAVAPAFPAALARDPLLREFYLASVPLRPRRPDPAAPRGVDPAAGFAPAPQARDSDGSVRLDSAGPVQITLRRAPFAAASAPVLTISLQRTEQPATGPVTVAVSFRGTFGPWTGTLAVPADGTTVQADLRQLCAFALSESVSDLELTLPSPARCRLRVLQLGP